MKTKSFKSDAVARRWFDRLTALGYGCHMVTGGKAAQLTFFRPGANLD